MANTFYFNAGLFAYGNKSAYNVSAYKPSLEQKTEETQNQQKNSDIQSTKTSFKSWLG